ncbi:MAG: hypothetical protein EBU46_21585 [Nitrosomonadaceae bacterium]|nr:hypothetical protein [Nitrosomonadaceae bacterium]
MREDIAGLQAAPDRVEGDRQSYPQVIDGPAITATPDDIRLHWNKRNCQREAMLKIHIDGLAGFPER